MKSDILSYTFDFDQWPSQHTDDKKYLRQYNGSIFDLQFSYTKIFHEEGFKDVIGNIDDLNSKSGGGGIDSSRIYKIKYVLNLIPSFGQHMVTEDKDDHQIDYLNRGDIPLMYLLSTSEEFDIWNTNAMQNYIEFKWNKVGRNHHAFAAILHLCYLIYMCYYVNDVYINASYQERLAINKDAINTQATLFIVFAIYPTCYETL